MASDTIYVVDITVYSIVINLRKLQSYGTALSSISHRNSSFKAINIYNDVCVGILILKYLSSDC